ncbi:MAG: hypothetical protein MJZ51_07230 [Bacteroidales bacterium]|nr:hypothetical protein [Bacteroidales bacterium]
MLEGNYLRERPSGLKSTKNQTKNHLKNPYHQHTATKRIVLAFQTESPKAAFEAVVQNDISEANNFLTPKLL